MKHAVKHTIVVMLMCIAMLLCACTATSDAAATNDAAIHNMQRLYRSSSLVVVASCFRTHTDAAGESCADVKGERTVAGSLASSGDTLHCPSSAMKEGESYLLYLTTGDDVYQTEDVDRFSIVNDTPFRVEGDLVYASGAILDMAAIESDIANASRTVSVQLVSKYYRSVSSLSVGSDYIFIGRIKKFPKQQPMDFRSNDSGAIVENRLPASLISVEVYGSLKGGLNYGDNIQLVYCPAMCQDIIDAATLKPAACAEDKLPVPEEGGTYLFFLCKGPDEKQDYYFGVNPIQFMAELDDNNTISVGSANRAFNGYRTLDAVVKTIRKVLNG